jgi:hypothetical protein
MTEELQQFVASLAIPDDRKAVVLAELTDHLASVRETATREGRDPEAAARELLGNLESLRRSFEAIEPAFRVTRWQAFARGAIAAVVVAIVLDRGGTMMRGFIGAVVAIAIVALAAPPRILDLLRADLRAPRIRGSLGRSVPVGAAFVYAFTVISGPFVVWIGLIVERAFAGVTVVDVPWSAFAVMTAVWATLLFEGIRARREAIA